MKVINESHIRAIVSETLRNVLRESADIEGLLKQLKEMVKPYIYAEPDEYGFKSNIVDSIINGYFYDYDNWKDYDQDPPFKVTAYGLYELGYAVLNYDLIVVNEDGTVDVYNSNHKDIAELMKQIVPQDIWVKIHKNLFGPHTYVD